MIYFYLSPCKDFKNYYLYYLSHKYKGYCCLPSYSRIIQLWPRMLLLLAVLMHYLKGDDTGIYYIDSTKLAICHNKRTSSNRVFNRISKIGKSSYGWFLGFKLHIIINNKGEIMSVKITKGNKSHLSIIESVFNILKKHMHLEHTKHRSHINFFVHIKFLLLLFILSSNLIPILSHLLFLYSTYPNQAFLALGCFIAFFICNI
ncbi:transposase DDE domain protein [Orientia tsutsugamushi str. UT144]|uniref:Transposase DDE domain protein n=1 Tax=Orientia tsutsugamushi str. UT144 TaxID=1441384 RepID=A0A0F3RNB1_ORITS|nr:transposase DDE domain protein [Orientia tsutsugamushi str. UT144]